MHSIAVPSLFDTAVSNISILQWLQKNGIFSLFLGLINSVIVLATFRIQGHSSRTNGFLTERLAHNTVNTGLHSI